jgi:exodeoxyribonuclease VII large subunit
MTDESPSIAPPVWSVSAFVGKARRHVERAFDDIRLEGELSNFKRHTSGHCYFSLKDRGAQVRGVMWAAQARSVFFRPEDGMFVQVDGRASIYEPRGEFQVVVRAMRLAGEGALSLAFEALKAKLEAEGLFDPAKKKPLPAFPERIGIVTSGSGAVLHDLLSVIERRYPLTHVLVCPVQVQGMGAAESIAEAIEAFDAVPIGDPLRADVLIVGRGGGSAEDLWAFNEERVARAIHASSIPIVSAVGHETDVTIADFVADVRAATPSMAAEIATPDRAELLAGLRGTAFRLEDVLQHQIERGRQRLRALAGSYGLRQPLHVLDLHRQRLDEWSRRLGRTLPTTLSTTKNRLEALSRRLAALDPERPLRLGYALVFQSGGQVRSMHDIIDERPFTLRFHDGERTARLADASHTPPAS